MDSNEDFSSLDSHQETDQASHCAIESTSEPSDRGSFTAPEANPFLDTPAGHDDIVSTPHTPIHDQDRSQLMIPFPLTPCKTPCKPPTAALSPHCVPTILYTPTDSASGSKPDTPSSRSRLLSPRPIWKNSTIRLTNTLRRAASFASFGEKSINEDQDEERRVSSEPTCESPCRVDEQDLDTSMVLSERRADPEDLQDGLPACSQAVQPTPFLFKVIAQTASPQRKSPKTPTKGPHEIRASILSTGSELSAQWYRSPRERLGLFLTVTKRGAAPWERRVNEKTEQADNVAEVMMVGKRSWRSVLFGSLKRG